jgi:hypothetical protein
VEPPPEKWKLIVGAPTDGRDIQVAVLPGGRQLVARWHPTLGAWVAADEFIVQPTHYKLLDEGPSAPKGEGPRLLALSPAQAALGDPSFTLRVLGLGFTEDSVIFWNGSPEPTTVVSPTEVTTSVNMETAAVAMAIPVAVQTGGEDGPVSNTLIFTLTPPASAQR